MQKECNLWRSTEGNHCKQWSWINKKEYCYKTWSLPCGKKRKEYCYIEEVVGLGHFPNLFILQTDVFKCSKTRFILSNCAIPNPRNCNPTVKKPRESLKTNITLWESAMSRNSLAAEKSETGRSLVIKLIALSPRPCFFIFCFSYCLSFFYVIIFSCFLLLINTC